MHMPDAFSHCAADAGDCWIGCGKRCKSAGAVRTACGDSVPAEGRTNKEKRKMANIDMLMEDVRMKEGLQSCMNCGVCTGVCPAAEFYNCDPRQIVNIVQTRDDDAIEELLKSDTIWYCAASACRAVRAVRAATRRAM